MAQVMTSSQMRAYREALARLPEDVRGNLDAKLFGHGRGGAETESNSGSGSIHYLYADLVLDASTQLLIDHAAGLPSRAAALTRRARHSMLLQIHRRVATGVTPSATLRGVLAVLQDLVAEPAPKPATLKRKRERERERERDQDQDQDHGDNHENDDDDDMCAFEVCYSGVVSDALDDMHSLVYLRVPHNVYFGVDVTSALFNPTEPAPDSADAERLHQWVEAGMSMSGTGTGAARNRNHHDYLLRALYRTYIQRWLASKYVAYLDASRYAKERRGFHLLRALAVRYNNSSKYAMYQSVVNGLLRSSSFNRPQCLLSHCRHHQPPLTYDAWLVSGNEAALLAQGHAY